MSETTVHVQIDPGQSLCWESDETIRIGFDRGHVRIKPLTPEAERVFHALVYGIPEPEFVGYHSGPHADEHGILALIRALEPVLVRTEVVRGTARGSRQLPPSAIRAQLHDGGRTVSGLQEALEAHWLCTFDRGSTPPELVVQVLRFLEPLEHTRRWLGAAVPHLVIRLTDDAIRIGPLVSTSGHPCHSCEALHLVDADPDLPHLAVQLYGKTPGSETAANGQLIGALAAQFVRAWHRGELWVHTEQLTVPIRQREVAGLPRLTSIRPHPDCGCTLEAPLTELSQPPPQTETAHAALGPHSQSPKRAACPSRE